MRLPVFSGFVKHDYYRLPSASMPTKVVFRLLFFPSAWKKYGVELDRAILHFCVVARC
jgi:hypothetical protein